MRPEEATTYRGVSTTTTPANVGPAPAGNQATSPGISGQTPPPPPVAPVSPRKTMSLDQVEAGARRAVSEFIKAKYGPHARNDQKLIEKLKSSAISFADEYRILLTQVDPNNLQKLSDAKRLLRQALETKQGLAEISQDILANKFAKLFVTEQGLKRLLDDPRGAPLTEQEKRNVNEIIWEAGRAARENLGAWRVAFATLGPHGEPYRDTRLCEIGLGSALGADTRTSILIKGAEFYVRELDRRAQSPATKNH
jgi:hypothetical protein